MNQNLRKEYFLPQCDLVLTACGEPEVQARLLSWFERSLVHHRPAERRNPGLPVLPLELSLSDAPAAQVPASAALVRGAYRHRVLADDSRTYFLDEQEQALVCFVDGNAQLMLTPSAIDKGTTSDAFLLAYYLCFPAFEHFLSEHGIFAIHAAAVAGPAGAALLFGIGGAGKSTLALALRQQGLTLLSEDRPLLRVAGGLVEVLPSLGGPKLTPSTYRLFPDLLPPETSATLLDEKYLLRFTDLAADNPAAPKPRTILNQAYFLNRANDNSLKIAGLSPATAFERMLRLELFVLLPGFVPMERAAQQFQVLTQVVAQSRMQDLFYRDDELNQVARFIAAACTAAAAEEN